VRGSGSGIIRGGRPVKPISTTSSGCSVIVPGVFGG
jgi:hypothetical protein